MDNDYVVTADVWDTGRDWITRPMSKSEANARAKQLKKDMENSIPKYKYATNIKVEKVDI